MKIGRNGSAVRSWMVAATVCVALAGLIMSVLPADAQSRRPDARQMTCAQVQGLIAARGAVVLTTGQRTFDRFVRHGGFCARQERAWRETIRTRDARHCPVYRCDDRHYRFLR